MEKLLDLRFIIGVFFALVGVLLLGYSFVGQNTMDAVAINRWSSLVFLGFGLTMLFFSLKKEA